MSTNIENVVSFMLYKMLTGCNVGKAYQKYIWEIKPSNLIIKFTSIQYFRIENASVSSYKVYLMLNPLTNR